MSEPPITSVASEQLHPTAITGTWSDLESQARYVYYNADHFTTEWVLAEAVFVLLNEVAQLKKRLGYPGFAR